MFVVIKESKRTMSVFAGIQLLIQLIKNQERRKQVGSTSAKSALLINMYFPANLCCSRIAVGVYPCQFKKGLLFVVTNRSNPDNIKLTRRTHTHIHPLFYINYVQQAQANSFLVVDTRPHKPHKSSVAKHSVTTADFRQIQTMYHYIWQR